MLGIKNIGIYVPENIVSNEDRIYRGEKLDEKFLKEKIGVLRKAILTEGMDTSDLCVKAFEDLAQKEGLEVGDVDCICVCTETPDYQLPGVAALVHQKLQLASDCAFFDISLGCSGYVYGLKVLQGFMQSIGAHKGILFTADPYSKIIDKEDKNTDLLFGDAATATLLSDEGNYRIGEASFASATDMYDSLIKRTDEPLFMDGRKIFNFALRQVPGAVNDCLEKNGNPKVELTVLHQASKYVVDALAKKLSDVLLEEANAFWDNDGIGNTVSSSIPVLLQKYLSKQQPECVLLCGFGVGLSVAAVILQKGDPTP